MDRLIFMFAKSRQVPVGLQGHRSTMPCHCHACPSSVGSREGWGQQTPPRPQASTSPFPLGLDDSTSGDRRVRLMTHQQEKASVITRPLCMLLEMM